MAMIDTVIGKNNINPYSTRQAVAAKTALNLTTPSLFNKDNFQTGLSSPEIMFEAERTLFEDGIFRNAPELVERWGMDTYGDYDSLSPETYSISSMFKSEDNKNRIRSQYLGMLEPAGTNFNIKNPDGTETNRTAQKATVTDPNTGRDIVTGNAKLLLSLGDVGTVLDNLNRRDQSWSEGTLKSTEWLTGTIGSPGAESVSQGFYPVYDPELKKYIYQGFVGTGTEIKKLEAAGQAIVNQYGPKPFSSNIFATLGNSTMHSFINFPSTWASMTAGVSDIFEAMGNAATGKGFDSDYDETNALADQLTWEHNSQNYHNIGSTRAEAGFFDNPIGFTSGVGQGIGSLFQYAAAGGAARNLFSGGWNIAKALGKAVNVEAGVLGSEAALTAATEATGGLYSNAANWAKNLVNNPTNLAMLSTGTIINGGEAYQEARQAGLSLEDASLVALMTGPLMAAVEVGFGANTLERFAIGARGGRQTAREIVQMYGGDLTQLDNPRNVAGLFNKITTGLQKIGGKNALGSALEEGGEEIVQGMIKNSGEWLYDTIFAGDSEKGKGYFGVNPFSAESFMNYLEEGTVGFLLGGVGGVFANRKQRNQSILPFIARNEDKVIREAVNYAYGQQAISEAQRDQINKDIDNAILLRDNNKDLFSQIARFKPDVQGKIAETLLSSLDAQQDFINQTEGIREFAASTDPVERSKYEEYWNELEGALWNSVNQTVTTQSPSIDGQSQGETFRLPIHTTTSLIKQLEDAGRIEEAKLIKTAYNDAIAKSETYIPRLGKNVSDSLRMAHSSVSNELLSKLAILNAHNNINSKKLQILNNERMDLTSNISSRPSLLAIQTFYERAISEFQPTLEKYIKNYNNVDDEIDRADLIDGAQAELDKILEKVETESRKYGAAQDIIPFVNNLIKTANISLDQRFNQETTKQSLDSANIEKDIRNKSREYTAQAEQNKANNTNVGEETAPEGNIETETDIEARTQSDLDKTLAATNQMIDDVVDDLNRYVEDGDVFTYGDVTASLTKNKNIPNLYTAKITDPSRNISITTELSGEPQDVLDMFKSEIKKATNDSLTADRESEGYFHASETSAENQEALNSTETANLVDDTIKTGENFENSDKLPKADNYLSKEVTDLLNRSDLSNRSFENGYFGTSDNWDEIQSNKSYRQKAVKLFNGLNSVDDFNKLSEVDKKTIVNYLPITYTFKRGGKDYVTYLLDKSSVKGDFSTATDKYRYNLILAMANSKNKRVRPAKGSISRTPGYWNNLPKNITDRNNFINTIQSLKLIEENGVYKHVLESDNNGPTKTVPLRMGIAARNNTITYYDDSVARIARGWGSPGTVYIVMPGALTIGKENNYVIKVNPQKISIDAANVAIDLMSDMTLLNADQENTEATRKSIIKPGNKFGVTVDPDSTLTYGELLNYLVFEGPNTVIDVKTHEEYSYLLNKTLRMVPSQGIIRYGYNEETADHYVYNPSSSNPTLQQDRQAFLDWMVTNKNFSVQFSYMNQSIKDGDKVHNNFEVAGLKAIKGTTFISWLVNNGIVKSDLDPTSTLLRNSSLTFNGGFEIENKIEGDSNIDVTPGKTNESETNTSEQPTVVSAENPSQTVVTSTEETALSNQTTGVVDKSDRSALIEQMREALNRLTNSTENFDENPEDMFFEIENTGILNESYVKGNLSKELNHYRRMFSVGTRGVMRITNKPILMSDNYFDKIKPGDINNPVKVRDLVDVMGNSGNAKYAWGSMNIDGITIYDGALEGTVYHEAFHRVSLLYLNPTERQSIYDKARVQYNQPNATDNEIEEVLAESFRKFVLEETRDIVYPTDNVIQKWFRSLKKFLSSFIDKFVYRTPNISSLEGLYKSIWNSAYRFTKPNPESLESFMNRYPNVDVGMEIESPSGRKTTLNQIHDNVTLNKIVTALTALTLNTNNIEVISDLRNKISYQKPADVVKSLLIKTYDTLVNDSKLSNAEFEQLTAKASMYQEIYDNFNNVFKPAINSKLNFSGLRSKTMDEIMSDREENSFLDNVKNDEVASSYEYSSKETANTNIKLLFQTLKSSNTLNPTTFLPDYADYDTAWFNVMRLLHDANSIEEMKSRLVKESAKTTELRYLGTNVAEENYDNVNMYSSLLDKINKSSDVLQTQFWVTFKKHRHNFVNMYFSGNNGTNSYSFGSADIAKRSNNLAKEWSRTFALDKKHTSENKDGLNKIRKDWNTLYKQAIKGKFDGDFQNTLESLVKILNNLGLQIDDSTIIQATNNFNDVSPIDKLRSLITDQSKYNIDYTIRKFLQEIYNQDTIRYGKKRTLSSENYLYSQKMTKEFAKDYVSANPVREDDSVLGPDGNNVYSYSEYNFITQSFAEFLKDSNYLQQLQSETINSSSVWLKQLMDESVRDNISVDTMLSMIRDESSDRGRDYVSISGVEDTMLKMNSVFHNKLPIPVLANKKTYHFITGLERQEVVIYENKNTNTISIDKDTVNVFYNYFMSERSAIAQAKKARNNFLKNNGLTIDEFNQMSEEDQQKYNYKNLVENYHYKVVSYEENGYVYNKIDLSQGNGYNYRYFPSFASVSENNLPAYDIPNIDPNTPQYVAWQNLENTKISNAKNIIKKMLTSRINETIQKFEDLGIIKLRGELQNISDSIGTTTIIGKKSGNRIKVNAIESNNLIDINHLTKVAEKYQFDDVNDSNVSPLAVIQSISDYAINTAIATIEFDKIVHGDLAFFKNPDDRVKRYSALSATGLVLNKDMLDAGRTTYNTVTFKSNIVKSQDVYDKLYNTYVNSTNQSGKLYENYKMFRDQATDDGVKYARFKGKTDSELMKMAEKDSKDRLKRYLKTDQTDGQVLIHPRFYRDVNKMIGEWSDEKEAAFNLLMSDKELSTEEAIKAYTQVVMQPLKLMYFGKQFENNIGIPTYDKPAYFTIFKRMVEDTDLEKVFDMMDQENIDTVQFQSATKVGIRQGVRTYNPDNTLKESWFDELNSDELNKFTQQREFRYLRRQLNTDPHEVHKMMLGTQAAKIGIAGVIDNGTYVVGDEGVSGSQLKTNWNESISELTNRGLDRLFKEWGVSIDENGNSKLTPESFVKFLRKEASGNNMPMNFMNSLGVDENGNYRVHPSAYPSMNWVQSKILSLVKKRVIDINLPGNAMVQMSNYGFKNSNIKVIELPKNEISYSYADNKELSFRDPSNRLEAIVSVGLFKQFVPGYDKMSFEEVREFLLKNDITIMGYRIPTQGQNSIVPLHIVDILPETLGDVVILPSEFTTLTGSDFDIDKLYVANYNYERIPKRDGTLTEDDQIRYNELYEEFINTLNWSEKLRRPVIRALEADFDDNLSRIEFGNIHDLKWLKSSENESLGEWSITLSNDIRKVPYDNSKPLSENSTEAIENRILDIYLSVLTSNEHVLETTTPLDATTQPLKDAVSALDSVLEKKKINDLELLFPNYQLQIKQQNTGADAGIGPMALANTHQVFTEIVKLEFNPKVVFENDNLIEATKLTSLHNKYGNDGVLIMDWTSALINAHVDAAKDPYILKLNVNKYTYSATTMMFRTGVGESTLYFMPQSILKDVADKYIQLFSGKLGVDEDLKIGNKWIDKIIQEYKGKRSSLANKEGMFVENLPKAIDYAKTDHKDGYIFDKNWLMKQLSTKEADRNAMWYHNQLVIYEYFDQINRYGSALSDLVSASQIDTAKYGKNASELTIFKGLVEKARSNEYFINPSKIYDNTFLGKKYESSVNMVFDLFGKELLEFSPSFQSTVKKILTKSKQGYTKNSSTINNVSNEVKSAVLTEFFKEYSYFMGYNMKDLLIGENSLVNEYLELWNRINTDDSLSNLRDNALLKLLRPGVVTTTESEELGNPMLFTAYVGKSRDASSMDDYTMGWRDLLLHSNDDVQIFGEKLILYSFYTSGGTASGLNNLFNLVPYDILSKLTIEGDITYNQYINSVVKSGNVVNSFKELEQSIYRNLWYNDDLVPVIGTYGEDNVISSKYVTEQQKGIKEISKFPLNIKMSGIFARNNDMGIIDGVKTFREYIQFSKSTNRNKQDSIMYRYVGYVQDAQGRVLPVYQLVNKLGYSYKGYVFKEGDGDFKSIIPSNNVNNIDPNLFSVMDTLTKDVYDPSKGDIFIPYDGISNNTNESVIQSIDQTQTNDDTSYVLDNNETPVVSNEVVETPAVELQPFTDGKLILNPEQQTASDLAINFINNGNPSEWFVVEGKAGVGKTTMISDVIAKYSNKNVAVAALSHKAKKVIRNGMESAGIKNGKYYSIAGLLGLQMNLETGVFEQTDNDNVETPIENADIIVIDEASMINEEARDLIMSNKKQQAKVIFLGDVGQLPPIRSANNSYYKNISDKDAEKISPVFNTNNKARLLTRVRQGEDSPILPFADFYWNNSQSQEPVINPAANRNNIITDNGALIFTNSLNNIQDMIFESFRKSVEEKNPNHIKIVTYRNNKRERMNSVIHNRIFGENSNEYNVGELMMFNDSFSVDTNTVIENSTEFQITDVSKHRLFRGLKVYDITFSEEDNDGKLQDFTVPVLSKDSVQIHRDMVSKAFADARAQKGKDKRTYIQLLRNAWDLKNKFANVDYAYAITSHKSQGSTYDIVIVDEKDIIGVDPISNRSKSRSIYTAITRARNITVVISQVPVENNVTQSLEQINNNIDLNKGVVNSIPSISTDDGVSINKQHNTEIESENTISANLNSINTNTSDITENFQTTQQDSQISTIEQLRQNANQIIGELHRAVDYSRDSAYESANEMYNRYEFSLEEQLGETNDINVTVNTKSYSFKSNNSGDIVMIHRSPDLITEPLMAYTKDLITKANKNQVSFNVLSTDQIVVEYLRNIDAKYNVITSERLNDNVETELLNSTPEQIYNRYREALSGDKYGITDVNKFVTEWNTFTKEEKALILKDLKTC